MITNVAPGQPDVRLKDIPLFKVFMADTAAAATASVLNSGYIGQGPRVEEFESKLKDFFQTDYIATVNSATSAEALAYHMFKKPGQNLSHQDRADALTSEWPGLEPGDEVLTTALTCTATNWPILQNDLRIKWVDVDPETLNIDLLDLERKISKKTKIISFVHWGGYPVDLDRVRTICQNARDVFGFYPRVLEDCAHALGSTYKGKPIGSHGNTCTFSFQAIKHITTGDGGLLVLQDKAQMARAKLLRWYGIDREGDRKDFRCEADVAEWGFKYHMNDIAAAIGIENLKHVNYIVGRHQDNAAFYDEALRDIDGIVVPTRHNDRKSAFWIYSILVERKLDFQRAMKDRGVACSQVHERNDIHSCVREFRTRLPNLDMTVPKLSSLPVGWWVSDEDREYIIECIKKGW